MGVLEYKVGGYWKLLGLASPSYLSVNRYPLLPVSHDYWNLTLQSPLQIWTRSSRVSPPMWTWAWAPPWSSPARRPRGSLPPASPGSRMVACTLWRMGAGTIFLDYLVYFPINNLNSSIDALRVKGLQYFCENCWNDYQIYRFPLYLIFGRFYESQTF